jgi:peptidoglycan/LPS O-acetylase OafA/YrhL
MKHLPFLDGWRGLAIAFLLIGHFFPVPGLNVGRIGVNFFFVLSGLLMARLLFVEQVPLKRFYQRRIARIFPAVYAFIGVMIMLYLVTGRELDWDETWRALLFVNNYHPGNADMPFGHIWSLSVEEHSYVVLSLAAVLVVKLRLRAAAACGVLALASALLAAAYSLYGKGGELYLLLLRSEAAAFGILGSAFLLVRLQSVTIPAIPGWVIAGLAGLGIVLHWWSLPPVMGAVCGIAAFALAVNLLPHAPGIAQRLLSFPPLCLLGTYSFSIYLWQQPFYLLTEHGKLDPFTGLALGVLSGCASFYLLERPARAWLNKRWDARRSALQSAG